MVIVVIVGVVMVIVIVVLVVVVCLHVSGCQKMAQLHGAQRATFRPRQCGDV